MNGAVDVLDPTIVTRVCCGTGRRTWAVLSIGRMSGRVSRSITACAGTGLGGAAPDGTPLDGTPPDGTPPDGAPPDGARRGGRGMLTGVVDRGGRLSTSSDAAPTPVMRSRSATACGASLRTCANSAHSSCGAGHLTDGFTSAWLSSSRPTVTEDSSWRGSAAAGSGSPLARTTVTDAR